MKNGETQSQKDDRELGFGVEPGGDRDCEGGDHFEAGAGFVGFEAGADRPVEVGAGEDEGLIFGEVAIELRVVARLKSCHSEAVEFDVGSFSKSHWTRLDRKRLSENIRFCLSRLSQVKLNESHARRGFEVMTLHEVEQAIVKFSPEELATFRAWFVAFDRIEREQVAAGGRVPIKSLAGICADDPIVIDDDGISDALDDDLIGVFDGQ